MFIIAAIALVIGVLFGFFAACAIFANVRSELETSHKEALEKEWTIGWDAGWKSASEDAGYIRSRYKTIMEDLRK